MNRRAETVAVRVRSEQDQGLRIRELWRARTSSILSSVWAATKGSDLLVEGGGLVGEVHVSAVN